jgi:biopolymer transport protein ExbD
MTINPDGRRRAEVNVTPMIDILFVLIILFMVITPITSRGLPALVPQPPSAGMHDDKPPSQIVITVRGNGTILLNRESFDLASLRAKLEHLYKTGASNVIFVRGDKAIEFGRVAEVIDLARGAGVYHVALMTN